MVSRQDVIDKERNCHYTGAVSWSLAIDIGGVMRGIDRDTIAATGAQECVSAFEQMKMGDKAHMMLLSVCQPIVFNMCFPLVLPGTEAQFDENDLFEWSEPQPRQVPVVVEAPGTIACDCGWYNEEDD